MKKIIDIGANLTDLMYKGIYNGKQKHSPDLENVLERSWAAGLKKIIITGGNLEDSKLALDLAKTDDRLYSTVGCHPTRCQEFEKNGTPEEYLEKLEQLAIEGKRKVIAIGECGLDYDRLEFCGKDLQLKYFEWQLTLSLRLNLPLFLHCRNASSDLIDILKEHTGLKGVVHSFDGTKDDVAHLIDMGLFIGINGCSLKTADNLSTMSTIPTDRLMIETDCPWCEVRPTHSGNKHIQSRFPSIKKEKWSADSMVKGRNEPCNIIQILEIMSAVRNEDIDELANKIYENTVKLFFSKENL